MATNGLSHKTSLQVNHSLCTYRSNKQNSHPLHVEVMATPQVMLTFKPVHTGTTQHKTVWEAQRKVEANELTVTDTS